MGEAGKSLRYGLRRSRDAVHSQRLALSITAKLSTSHKSPAVQAQPAPGDGGKAGIAHQSASAHFWFLWHGMACLAMAAATTERHSHHVTICNMTQLSAHITSRTKS
jgi:hypothetical protein